MSYVDVENKIYDNSKNIITRGREDTKESLKQPARALPDG